MISQLNGAPLPDEPRYIQVMRNGKKLDFTVGMMVWNVNGRLYDADDKYDMNQLLFDIVNYDFTTNNDFKDGLTEFTNDLMAVMNENPNLTLTNLPAEYGGKYGRLNEFGGIE